MDDSKCRGVLHTPQSHTPQQNKNMNYDPQIHHRRSIRLEGYDYSQEGMYFITICTLNKNCIFGNIINDEMQLNETGTIAYNEWLQTPVIRKSIDLDVFVLMPNHIHGIIIIRSGVCNEGVYKEGVCNTPLRIHYYGCINRDALIGMH